MNVHMKPTRTHGTEARYREIVHSLWNQFCRDCIQDFGKDMGSVLQHLEHLPSFMRWFELKAKELRPSTVRLYTSALKYILAPVLTSDTNKFFNELASVTQKKKKLANRTSSSKSKSFDIKYFNSIIDELADNRTSQYALPLICWLHSGVMFGLRPAEWAFTSIEAVEPHEIGFPDDDIYTVGIILNTINAKRTNGRSHGEKRQLKAALTEEQYAYLYAHLGHIEEADDFDLLYNNCRNLLLSVNKLLFNRRRTNITLYSLRHQFNANIKAYYIRNRIPLREGVELLAAMNGHASIETASEHYGRASGGWSNPPCRIKPSEQSLQAVKEINKDVVLDMRHSFGGRKSAVATNQHPIAN